MASATAEHPGTVVVHQDAHGSPFAGMTVAQARVLNSAVLGLPVEVAGGRFAPEVDVYIFGGIMLPPGLHTALGSFRDAGDLQLWHAERIRGGGWAWRYGSSRILSAVLVRSFKVLAGEPMFRVCEECRRTMALTEKAYDDAQLNAPIAVERDQFGLVWQHRLVCRACWEAW